MKIQNQIVIKDELLKFSAKFSWLCQSLLQQYAGIHDTAESNPRGRIWKLACEILEEISRNCVCKYVCDWSDLLIAVCACFFPKFGKFCELMEKEERSKP